MAHLKADLGFNSSDFNLWLLRTLADAVRVSLDEALTIDGVFYSDFVDVFWPDHTWTYFAASDLTYDAENRQITAGLITGIFEKSLLASQSVPSWSLQGISVSAAAMWNSAFTQSLDDDRMLLSQALSGADTFDLSNFADVARGYGGNDTLRGYDGNDNLRGDSGNDVLKGDGGNDVLLGDGGNDSLYGDSGRDTITGGLGADRLEGGALQDILRGESGADDFVYVRTSDSAPASTSRDIIIGFTRGLDDIIVSQIDAKSGSRKNDAFIFDRDASFSAGEIRQKVTSAGLVIEFNTDSDSTAEMAILLLGMTTRLAWTDFEP